MSSQPIDYMPRIDAVHEVKKSIHLLQVVSLMICISVLLLAWCGSSPLSAVFAIGLLWIMCKAANTEKNLLMILNHIRPLEE